MDKDEPNSGDAHHKSQSREKRKHGVLKPGEGFGNFRVVKCLCAGLIANYYHMQHIRDLHDVTVAIFHHRAAKDARFTKRLANLQKALKGFDHDGIPKIHDCTEINDYICLFLDPVKGEALSQYVDAHATPGREGLGTETTTRILAQLLGLLGYAHTQGVDHRDIDSDMVFIQKDGSIRLLGLGVKAALGAELFEAIVSASVSPLASNKTMGRLNSFDVMSPEYKAGVPEDSRVDLFCVGVIGYWLLTARKPDRVNLEMPTTLVDGLPLKWDHFLKGLLEREQDERFQSCKMALLALKETDDEPESERVGTYSSNAYGLYDIHGNVSEWTIDAYNGRLPGGKLTDPDPRTGGKRYTLRGGSWEDFAVRVRSAARTEARMDTESNAIGFRVFLAPQL